MAKKISNETKDLDKYDENYLWNKRTLKHNIKQKLNKDIHNIEKDHKKLVENKNKIYFNINSS